MLPGRGPSPSPQAWGSREPTRYRLVQAGQLGSRFDCFALDARPPPGLDRRPSRGHRAGGFMRPPCLIVALGTVVNGLPTVIYRKLHRSAAAVCFCWAILLGACEQRPVVLSQALATDEKLLLSAADQAEILAAFRLIARDRTAVNPPRPAPGGLRWSDVQQAAAWAVAEPGVEMAIVQTLRHDETGMVINEKVRFGETLVWCYTFRLKTIEDRPAQLIVRRRDDRSVYETTATVGRFGDDHQRAEKLRKAFDSMMRAFGRKRGFNDPMP